MKKRSKILLSAVLTIALCLSLIAGSTFALFTSESKVNIAVTSGRVKVTAEITDPYVYSAEALDVAPTATESYYTENSAVVSDTIENGNYAGTYYYKSQAVTKITTGDNAGDFTGNFANLGTASYDASEQELTLDKVTPGDRVKFTVAIGNESNVAIQYRVVVNVRSGLKLYNALTVKIDGVKLNGVNKTGTWTYLAPDSDIADIPVEIFMPITTGNEYQDLSTEMSITVEAVQGNAKTTNDVLSTTVEAIAEDTTDVENNATTNSTTISDSDNLVTVTIPSSTALTTNDDSVTSTSLALKVKPQDTVSDITILSNKTSASYDVSVLKTTTVGGVTTVTDSDAIADDNTSKIVVEMFVGTGLTGVELYHKTDKLNAVASLNDVDELNEFYYDSASGKITFITKSFSEYTVVYNKDYAVETVNENNESVITVYRPTETEGYYQNLESGEVVEISEGANGEVITTTKFAGGQGTESDPFIISSVSWWSKFVDLTANDSDFSETAGKYFKVTTDLDVSSFGNNRANIHYFAGSIDFANHTFTGITAQNSPAADVGDDGITAIFSRIQGTVAISNLDFITTKVTNGSHTVAAQVTGINGGNVNVVFNNITTSGTVTGTNINNNGLFISYVLYGEANISLVNCNNYANIIGSGYKSVFLGNMGYGTVKTITANNCHNYGTIISVNAEAAMFIANAGYFNQNRIVTISNCSNEGNIGQNTAKERYNLFTTRVDSQYKYIVNGYDLSTITDSEFNSAIASDLSGSLVYTIESSTLSINDGKFVLNANENAVKYDLSFAFSAGGHAAGGGAGYVLTFTPEELATAEIMAYPWIDKQDATTEIVEHNAYGTKYYTSDGNYVFYSDDSHIRDDVFVTFITYGVNDTILSIATYQYSA